MARRGHGEGSIAQRADGVWVGRVSLGWQDGKRKRKTVYARTRRECGTKLTRALEQARQKIPFADERQTVGQFLKVWLTGKRSTLRARAFASYEQTIRDHVEPGIGRVKLGHLSPQHLTAWFQEHQEHGASARTIRYARTVLRAALSTAVKWQLVARNVAALVEVPRHTTKEIHPLTPDAARQLLDVADRHEHGGLVSVATAIGLRLGEALGLSWKAIDFDAGTLSIRQALERSGGDSAKPREFAAERKRLGTQIAAAPPRSPERRALYDTLNDSRKRARGVRTALRLVDVKSKRSRRTIHMPAVVVAALKAHRTRQREQRLAAGGAWQDTGLVFTSPIGTPLDPRNATRAFHDMLTTAGLASIRFHDLRHTAATLLLAQGVHARVVMETLGHSQISLTMDTYSHVIPTLQKDAAAKIDAVLGR